MVHQRQLKHHGRLGKMWRWNFGCLFARGGLVFDVWLESMFLHHHLESVPMNRGCGNHDVKNASRSVNGNSGSLSFHVESTLSSPLAAASRNEHTIDFENSSRRSGGIEG